MKRRVLQYSLIICLLLSAAFAAWGWFRPYAWRSDPAARCKVLETLVTPDQTFFWVTVHLEVIPGMTHDLQKPVYLKTAAGKRFEPADTTFAGIDPQVTTEIWFKFWLEPADLAGELVLHLNDGEIQVKAREGIPQLGTAKHRNFTSNQW